MALAPINSTELNPGISSATTSSAQGVNRDVNNFNLGDFGSFLSQLNFGGNSGMVIAENQKDRQFNSLEAEKNREWQRQMRLSQYPDMVKSLQEAGLNPVLAAINGGSTPSGATASSHGNAPSSNSGAIASVLTALINQQTQQYVADTNARTSLINQDKYIETMAEHNKALEQYNYNVSNEQERHNKTSEWINGLGSLLGTGAKVYGSYKLGKSKGLGKQFALMSLSKNLGRSFFNSDYEYAKYLSEKPFDPNDWEVIDPY